MHLYVSNLSVNVVENDLLQQFGQYGKVNNVVILTDPVTSNPIGAAIITMPQSTLAREAMKQLNLKKIKDRTVLIGPTPATGNRRIKSRLETNK